MKIEKKQLLNVALLSLITCRVYVIYWITVTTKDINSYMQKEYISPTLACILSINYLTYIGFINMEILFLMICIKKLILTVMERMLLSWHYFF